jgi:integrase
VDFEAGVIRVIQSYVRGQFQTPKSKKPRSVPMVDEVAAALDRLYQAATPNQAPDDLVFAHPQTGNPPDRSKISKRFKAAITRAQVGGFEPVLNAATGNPRLNAKGEPIMRPMVRFHDLRHTFATMLARKDFTMQEIQHLLEHADVKTTQIYAHYAPGHDQAKGIAEAFASDAVELVQAMPPEPTYALDANLRALTDLHAAGLLTAEEFAAKAALLAAA